jgi:hypothetical protein
VGSGLLQRRGMLRKPAECKPPPPPPGIPVTCLCNVSVTHDPLFHTMFATVDACSLLHAPGQVVVFHITSTPSVTWPDGGSILNCQSTAMQIASPGVPGTWYNVVADFVWPDGSTCSAFKLHFLT